MFKEYFALQKENENNDLPLCNPTASAKKNKPSKNIISLYKHTLAECADNTNLIPLLADFNIPISLEDMNISLNDDILKLSETEKMLKDCKEIENDFFCDDDFVQENEINMRKTDFKSASGGEISSKLKEKQNDKERVSDDAKECNVDQYILDRIESEILMINENSVTWEDIAGLEKLKKNITEIIIWPMLKPELFTGLRSPIKGLLLFGPPGTGKTMIGRCIAAQCNATFFSISASSLTSKWIGEGEKMVRAMFYVAKQKQPSVIFIDEIDSLLSARSDGEHESSRKLKTEFLIQFDGARSLDNDKILIIGATNRPQEIDDAARRRLVKRVYVPLPCKEARIEIIKRLLIKHNYKNNLTENDYQSIAQKTINYSGSDIYNLCREAVMEPLREIDDIRKLKESKDIIREIDVKDFIKSMKQIRKSVSEKELKFYEEWNEMYGST